MSEPVKAFSQTEELEKIIDLLESNARIQAKLLADTGRERDEIRIQLVNAMEFARAASYCINRLANLRRRLTALTYSDEHGDS
jgi:hypothetical protein